jgi:large subunit ribosomal protein L34
MHGATGTLALAPVRQQLLDDPECLNDAACVSGTGDDQPPQPAMELVKRTYQPSVIVRKRRHGFLSRLRSKGGQRVLERRRLKGRWKKSA